MIEYSFLRSQKAEALKKFYDAPFEKKEKLSATIYSNATILPLKKINGDSLLFGRGGVLNDQGFYIDSSAIPNRIQGSYDYTTYERINKKVVYCGYLVNQWGHFLIEAVARLWYFQKNDPTIDNYVFFLNSDEKKEISGNYREFFQLLGIWDKLQFINKPTQYREVVVPELSYNRMNYYSEEYKNIFKKVSSAALQKKAEHIPKIYLSRSKIKNIEKKEFGLKTLDIYFKNNGYKILHPEQLTLTELIAHISGAKEIATLSGSLHHNLLFAEDFKDIIILERSVLNNEIQVDINRMKFFNTTYIDANIPLYPVSVGFGPFIMAYNEFMDKFTKSRRLTTIEKHYFSERILKRMFKKYMICYHNTYGFKIYMEEWMMKYSNLLNEGYNAGMNYFGKFISNYSVFNIISSPLFWKNFIFKEAVRIMKAFSKGI